MKRKHRVVSKKRRIQNKKYKKTSRLKKASRKHSSARRKKTLLRRKRGTPINPRIAWGLGLMRREGRSASQAARMLRMKLATFLKGAGRFVYRSGRGKPWKVRSEDQLAFDMEVLTPQGRVTVTVRNSRERRLLHAYETALRMFRGAEDGALEELKRFENKSVGGQVLVTDMNQIIELEGADLVDFDSLYTSPGGRL
jgi:hypothetical protein